MDRSRLSQLAIFAEVARAGGFRAAARALDLTPSAISHAVAALEARLEVRLLNRTTRSLALTEAGQRLLDRLHPALGEIDEAVRDAREVAGPPSGRIRITTPPYGATRFIVPHLGAFAAAYPDISVDLMVEDRFVDIVADRYDIGVRLGESLQPDMVATRIAGMQRLTIVAAPAYFERHGRPSTLEDLAQHRCIHRRFSSGGLYDWEVTRDGAELTLSDMTSVLATNDDYAILAAARDGIGIAFVYEWRIADDLAAGRLIELFPEHCPPFPGLFLYHTSRRQIRPAVRAFIDFFIAANRAT